MLKKVRIRHEYLVIIFLFLLWRLGLILVSILAIRFLPLAYKDRFLGGGFLNYQMSPHFFSWANFDGEHYLSIAIFGYKKLEQAFFPVYPMMIHFFAQLFSKDYFSMIVNSTLTGLIISNSAFLITLILLYDLIKLDYSKKIAFTTFVILLIFPTSFYFGSLYNESLFLILSVICFLQSRKGNWLMASLFGMAASATRIFGILLFPALIIECILQKRYSGIFWLLLIPLGLGFYMYYQYIRFGDALAFYHLQTLVGEQRQSNLVILPQVYFRYFKMLTTVSPSQPIYQTILLEFLTGIMFFILPIYGYFKKIRLSYLFFALVGFIITTVQGSFSSVPRYVLVFFPNFIILALLINNRPKIVKILFFVIFFSVLIIETALFLRGYWVA